MLSGGLYILIGNSDIDSTGTSPMVVLELEGTIKSLNHFNSFYHASRIKDHGLRQKEATQRRIDKSFQSFQSLNHCNSFYHRGHREANTGDFLP